MRATHERPEESRVYGRSSQMTSGRARHIRCHAPDEHNWLGNSYYIHAHLLHLSPFRKHNCPILSATTHRIHGAVVYHKLRHCIEIHARHTLSPHLQLKIHNQLCFSLRHVPVLQLHYAPATQIHVMVVMQCGQIAAISSTKWYPVDLPYWSFPIGPVRWYRGYLQPEIYQSKRLWLLLATERWALSQWTKV